MSTLAERLIEAWNGGFDHTGQGESCYLTVRTRREEERVMALGASLDRVESKVDDLIGAPGGVTAEAIAAAILSDPAFPAMLEASVENVMARVGLVVRPGV